MKRRHLLILGVLSLGLSLVLLVGVSTPSGTLAKAQSDSKTPHDVLAPEASMGTAFTYQGRLEDNGSPANGPCDMRFLLYDAAIGGSQVGSTQTRTGVELSDGRFAVVLDFGANAFTGDARWLEIAVQCAGDTGYTTLGRQALKAAPYAVYATSAPWSGLQGVPADLADGDDDTTYSAGQGLTLSGRQFSVSTSYRLPQACGNGQIAEWNGSAWACGDDDVGAGDGGGDITAVYTGPGLTGGKASGDVTLNADTDYLQRRVGDGCLSGNAIRAISSTGGVTCESVTGGNDHNHLGQTWTGTDNPLRIEGSFGEPDHASLVLSNRAQSNGLRVVSAGWNGVGVGSAGGSGLYVGSAGESGVHVETAGTGVYVDSARNRGVYVDSAGWDGVKVESAGYDGVHVGSAGWDGVDATSTSASYYGGRFVNSAAGGAGLYAEGGSNSSPDIVLGGSSTEDDGRIYSHPAYGGSDILLFGNDKVHIHLDEDGGSTGNFMIHNDNNDAVFTVDEAGAVTFAGVALTSVDAGAYGSRAVYGLQSTGNWFEDFGIGQLVDGQATVEIEPVFAQTVKLDAYHVFLTPLGDCPLYVAEKTPVSFTVGAMGGQTCDVAFDYRIVAKRLGYEDMRLETVTLDADEESGE